MSESPNPQENIQAEIQEFLYMCPDTGITICMIQDGAGFRPATASDEGMSSPDSFFEQQLALTPHTSAADESESLDRFVNAYERSYAIFSP